MKQMTDNTPTPPASPEPEPPAVPDARTLSPEEYRRVKDGLIRGKYRSGGAK